MKYKLGEKTDFTIFRTEASLDRAADTARRMALQLFDVDECGHIGNVAGAERSSHCVEVWLIEFKMCGGMMGWDYLYTFGACVT